MGNHQSSPMETCLTAAVGGNADLVAFPSKILYGIQDVKPYNMDVDVHPIAVTYPQTVDQVSEIVKCATATAGYTVQPRGGGHSYANYGKSYPYTMKIRVPRYTMGRNRMQAGKVMYMVGWDLHELTQSLSYRWRRYQHNNGGPQELCWILYGYQHMGSDHWRRHTP